MIHEERYDKILSLLEERTYMSANELAELLYVSLPTIRRDLAALHSMGAIVRCRGGAKRVNSDNVVIPLNFRKTQNSKEKKIICKAAADMIKPNFLIFIDASTTAFHIIDLIPADYNVLVVTNSVSATLKLKERNIENICLGGTMQNASFCFAGEIAEAAVENFNFDIAFLSSGAIDENGIISDASLPETTLRKRVIGRSKTVVFLADDSKIGNVLPYNLGTYEIVDFIITNSEKMLSHTNVPKEKVIVSEIK